jgi:hypothetical protein
MFNYNINFDLYVKDASLMPFLAEWGAGGGRRGGGMDRGAEPPMDNPKWTAPNGQHQMDNPKWTRSHCRTS